MDLFVIVLRILHIVPAVFWVGGVTLVVRYLEPTAKATQQSGQKFMQHLMMRQQLGTALGGAAVVTVLAGALLYWRDSAGLQWTWITTGAGIGFTIGSLLGILALLLGAIGISPRAARLRTLATQIENAGGPPTPEQAAELSSINQATSQLFRWVFIVQLLALLAMATARYW